MRRYLVLFFVCIYCSVTNAQNVGIGVPNPQNKLHVGGGFRLDTLTGVNGAGLLKHDANGVVYGIKFSANTNDVLRGDGTFGPYNPAINGALGWLLTGNSGTNPATNFVGTTDDQPLAFRVNNIRHGYLGTSIFFGSNAGLANTVSGNIAFGRGSLQNNTVGTNLVAIGDSALFSNSVGSNTAIGSKAMQRNTAGSRNTAVGHDALSRNVLGNDNTAIGYNALLQNIGAGNSQEPTPFRGVRNTAVGSNALYSNVTGSDNAAFGTNAMAFASSSQSSAFGAYALEKNTSFSSSAFGVEALRNNTTGNYNAGFGAFVLFRNSTGYQNTAMGSFSLTNNNSYFNSALGAFSLGDNTSGHDNTALGYSAMLKNKVGSFNTSVGAFSLYNNDGLENVAVGYKSMEQNTTGIWNTAIGSGALQGNTQSNGNVAVGKNALNNNSLALGSNTAVGYNALRSNYTGYGNTAVGNQAALNNISGRYNTAIGFITATALPTNVENTTCLGYSTGWNTTISNQINIGNFSVSWIGGQTGWFHYSDERIKNDIKEDIPGLEFIRRLKPLSYHVDITKQEAIANGGKSFGAEYPKGMENDWEGKYDIEKIRMSGFLAQDVEEAAKSINYSFNGVHNPKNGGLYSLDYSAFVVPLVKAVQEQQKLIDEQNNKIDRQQQQIDLLIKEMQSLKNDLVTQKK